MKKVSSSIISVILLLLVVGCGSTNKTNIKNDIKRSPQSIEYSKKVSTNEELYLDINDTKCKNCVWKSEDGQLISNNTELTWKAPENEGKYQLTANITEMDGSKKIIKYNIFVDKPHEEKNNSNDNPKIPDDAIKIIDSSNPTPPNMNLHDPTPSGAYYKYIYDDDINGYVLQLHSNWIENSYHILGYDVDEKYVWNEHPVYQNKLHIAWDAKFSGDYIVFVVMGFKTADGEYIEKDLVYTPTPNGYEDFIGSFMQICLPNSNDGKWHHYQRDLLQDVRRFYPGATINFSEYKQEGEVNGFAVRGSGYITNIYLW